MIDRRWLWLCFLVVACGPKLPPRYVIEKDVGPYRYRRYQQVLDVEVPIAGNPAVGYTATYVRGGATVALVPVFVTSYDHAKGLTETVRGWGGILARSDGPRMFPLPHPSWRNNAWLKANPWFEDELLPALRREVRRALGH